jgi:hypothetical protein
MEIRRLRLPKHVQRETTRHGRRVYYFRRSNKSRRVRLEGEYGSDEFWKSYALAASGIVPEGILRRERVDPDQRAKRDAIALCVHRSLARAKHRAKKRGMAFNLTEEWVLEQMKQQDCKCALTGIPFLADEEGYRVRALAPSLDRIDCAWGYTTDNVRIVVFAVNAMLSDWGEELFSRIVDGYRRKVGS